MRYAPLTLTPMNHRSSRSLRACLTLACALILPNQLPAAPGSFSNGDFESGSVSPWTGYGIGAANYFAKSGSYSMYIEGSHEAVQVVTGLSSNSTYALSAYLRVGSAGDTITLGSRNHGGSAAQSTTSGSYTYVTIEFTTGPGKTSAELYLSRGSPGSWSWGYADDITLSLVSGGGSGSGGSGGDLTVRARLSYGSSDTLQLRVNDSTVDTFNLSSTFQSFTYSGYSGGNVKLSFPDNGTDAVVDYIRYDGQTFQAEDQAVNTAVWQGGSCGGSYSEMMHCSGYIDFGDISGSAGGGSGGGSNLVFSDEFNGSSLDSSKWTVGWPWGNTADHADEIIRAQNISVANGVLEIKADREGDQWYSGLIQTNGKFNRQFGTWEARIKTVNTLGFLTAFWAATNEGWPPEIDFMEVLGNDPSRAHFTQHYNGADGSYQVDGFEWNAGVDLSADWHVYKCVWDSNQISYYVDDNLIATFTNRVFEPLYLLLNLHVGMDWTGDPDPSNDTPEYMYVDWVRVYE